MQIKNNQWKNKLREKNELCKTIQRQFTKEPRNHINMLKLLSLEEYLSFSQSPKWTMGIFTAQRHKKVNLFLCRERARIHDALFGKIYIET